MDISAINTQGSYNPVCTTQKTPDTQVSTGGLAANTNNTSADPAYEQSAKKPVDTQQVKKMTEAMNQFVESMNSTIRFKIHEKTNELMVQVVDPTNNKVLKEFPPHEFLDTIAAIRDYVGVLLDKKI
ncbi:flagellar protein FlaG [Desulfosporosinus sp. PR]|uniref:flagellar protein FlaG n=1 Tax=Candidatus Desulfosporosinus nitrosoreducens TaxID=3401928 RepID=UPI0027E98367|nr:flagellar protein FlaG [Desulfosporosinus sp. PR]MDQ7096246.1 flagellar protein FlaG [Desulfosporosinus sp. PR]